MKKIVYLFLILFVCANCAFCHSLEIINQNGKQVIRNKNYKITENAPKDKTFEEIKEVQPDKNVKDERLKNYYYIAKNNKKYGVVQFYPRSSYSNKLYPDYDVKVAFEYDSIENVPVFYNVFKLYKNNKAYLIDIGPSYILPAKEVNKDFQILQRVWYKYKIKTNGKYGITDDKFNEIIPAKYENLELLKNSTYKVSGKYGNLSPVTEPIFDSITERMGKIGNKYYFFFGTTFSLNDFHIVAKDLKYIKDDYYKNFLAKKTDEKYAIVDSDDKQYTDYIYDDIQASCYTLHKSSNCGNKPRDYDSYIVTKDGKKGLIAYLNGSMTTLIPAEYDNLDCKVLHNDFEYKGYGLRNDSMFCPIFGYDKYLMSAKKDGKNSVLYFELNKKLNVEKFKTITLSDNAEKFVYTKNGIIYLINGKYGFINNEEKILLEPIYDLIYNPSFKETSNKLFVKKGEKYAIFDIKKKKLSDFIYDDIYLTKKSTIVAKNGSKKKTFNKTKGNLRNACSKASIVPDAIYRSFMSIPLIVMPPLMYFVWDGIGEGMIDMPKEEHPVEYFLEK